MLILLINWPVLIWSVVIQVKLMINVVKQWINQFWVHEIII